MKLNESERINRRKFLESSGAAVVGGTMALNLGLPANSYASSGANTLKVGLIGCGGRGTGAAAQALQADGDVLLTAMGDVFADRLEESHAALLEEVPAKMKVDKANKFVGFDAYRKVIESGVDVVLLATPPAFRPDHLIAAIEAGKHVFCEKPVAVDAPGVRKVLDAAKKAKAKKLSLVSGFTFRYDYSKRALFDKILNGAIGDVVSVSSTRNGGDLWYHPRQSSWTDMEYQMRNWYYQNWLSGDYLVEMIVHSLDLMTWAMGDKVPARATGTGGRQVRVDPKYGNIFDHFAIEFEYDNNVRAFSFSRQQPGCSNRNTVEITGTLGNAYANMGKWAHEITGKNKWIYDGEKNNPYQTQHDEFFASIRNAKPMNDGERMANSTMVAILGRMVAYSGQTLSWNDALNSTQVLGPAIDEYNWNLKHKSPDIAIPGITQVL
ncbi:Gfo/Idh/MocA family oxidoreductase [Chryseolinea sp. H1M3-3]|uniref:Gfo/Idh/MocA family protein n=1 Tax=Chryseolinea sp. H1M3-3 TaxID=3034144 RepID=UPI0023EC185E|nr:Gfo/Idh/MocA family oxidoreductase [Chryseolinea sp. H1M3-3]